MTARHGPSWMPILTTRSSVPRSALSASIAARIRKPAASACSGLTKVAITASPIVFTTAPFSDEMISSNAWKCARTRSNATRSPTRSYSAVEPLRSVQERQRGDLEALIDVEVVGLVNVAEGLVGQHPLGGQERLALADQMMKRIGRDEDRRQHPHVGLIVERQPQWPGTQCHGPDRRLNLVVDQR